MVAPTWVRSPGVAIDRSGPIYGKTFSKRNTARYTSYRGPIEIIQGSLYT